MRSPLPVAFSLPFYYSALLRNAMASLPIQRFDTVRYRGLEHISLDEPRRMNLVVGANNTGKTSVLEAIALYARPTDAWHWVRVVDARGPSQDRREVIESLRWAFPALSDQKRGSIALAAEGTHDVRRVEAELRELEAIAAGPEEGGLPEDDRPVIERTESGVALRVRAFGAPLPILGSSAPTPELDSASFEFWDRRGWGRPRVDRRHDLPVAYVAPGSHRDPRSLVRGVSVAIDAGMRSLLVEAARQFDSAISDVLVSDPSGDLSRVRVHHEKLGVVPLVAFGDGLRRTVAIASGILASRRGVLLIDEIETALHVRALSEVFPWLARLAADHDVQIFATTHSLEVVDALLDAEATGELSIYHLRRADDRVEVRRFPPDELRFLRHERALDIR